MGIDTPQTAHGLRMFVSPAAPAAQTAAAYNAQAFTAGANAYREVGLVMNFGENTITRTITSHQTCDLESMSHFPAALDQGSRVLQVLRDDDDNGQAVLDTLAGSKGNVVVKIMIERDNDNALPGGHDADDKAIYLRGILRDLGSPVGAAADVPMRNYGIQLTELEFSA